MVELYYTKKNNKYKYIKKYFIDFEIPFVEINLNEVSLSYNTLLNMINKSEHGLHSIVKQNEISRLEGLSLGEFYSVIVQNPHSMNLPILMNDKAVLDGRSLYCIHEEIGVFVPREVRKKCLKQMNRLYSMTYE